MECVKFLCEDWEADETVLDGNGLTPIKAAKEALRHEIAAYLGQQKEKRPKRKHKSKQKAENPFLTTVDQLLRTAASEGNEYSVRECIEQGAEVNSRNEFGATALHLAAAGNHANLVSVLVTEFGASVDMCKNWGDTPLHWAASAGHKETCRILVLELGARVDAENHEAGNTPLHLAAYNGHLECCIMLKNELGADVMHLNKLLKTPMEMAEFNDQKEVLAWCQELPEYMDDDDQEAVAASAE